MPTLGIGVNQVRSADVGPALAHAFEAGYRSVDTANTYLNERAVGQAVRDSGLPREDVFLATKLWSTESGYTRASAALDRTLKRLEQFGTVVANWFPLGQGNQGLLGEPLFAELGQSTGSHRCR